MSKCYGNEGTYDGGKQSQSPAWLSTASSNRFSIIVDDDDELDE